MRTDLLLPEPRLWRSNSIFSSVEEDYVAHLQAGRYNSNTVRVYLACVAHFAKWTTEEGLRITLINEAALERFLEHHVPFCSCRSPVRRQRHELRVAIRHLLHLLRSRGQIFLQTL